MDKIILMTPDELRQLIKEVLVEHLRVEENTLSDNLSIEDALVFLRENGFPTSKAKLYKLTAANKVPYRKYGLKLVFSRKSLLEWAESETIEMN